MKEIEIGKRKKINRGGKTQEYYYDRTRKKRQIPF